MMNGLGTAVCLVCIYAVDQLPVPVGLSTPIFITLGILTGYFVTKMMKGRNSH